MSIHGPERLDHFMARANAAYYARKDPFADFMTSPEISQVFGELLGGWSAVMWGAMGRPASVMLVECGPGRGSLMADALRMIGQVAPDFRAALAVHLVETSPRLRAAQMQKIPDAVWHDRVEDLPDGPMILLANEFLDALPIRQFVRRGAGWNERFVHEGALQEISSTETLNREAGEGEVIEICPAAEEFTAWLAEHLKKQAGAALIVDYGPARSAPGESLQALRKGAPVDPLQDPGEADLTAHVDFQALVEAARTHGILAYGPRPQGRFLTDLGLFPRTHQLARRVEEPKQAMALLDSASRLAEPTRMGELFKGVAMCSPFVSQIPPGFEG